MARFSLSDSRGFLPPVIFRKPPFFKEIMAKILVGVNVLTSVSSEVYGNHCELFFHLGRRMPEHEFLFFHPRRMSIDRMRNEAAKIALAHECDYLMFIDDDVMVDRNVVKSLLDADKDIIAALTYIRGYPFQPMIFKEIYKDDEGDSVLGYDTHFVVDQNGLVECKAVGFSCALIKCSLLRQLSTPYFITGSNHTEDVYFCVKARKEIPSTTIFTDTKFPTGHLLNQEAVTVENILPLKEYYKQFIKEDQLKGDIDPETIKRTLEMMKK